MTLPRIRALLTRPSDGIGPGQTCARLVEGMARGGADIDLMVPRMRGEQTEAEVATLLPGLLSYLPYRPIATPVAQMLERRYRRRLEPGEIAWLWPSVSLDLHRQLARDGFPIVLEGLTTRMAHAKPVLDAAYDAFGAPPGHGITEARIAEEEEKLSLATAIFAPSPLVEAALAGSPLENRFLRSSYGVDISSRHPTPPWNDRPEGEVTYLFCGDASVRKGVHHLLDLWPGMPANARLKLVGRIEPVIAERYSDLLASDKVDAVGFTRNVGPHYASADVFVFPALEAGDPLVSYEAALHGLPAVTSAAGAGRMGTERGTATIIDPTDRDAFEAALMDLHSDPDARRATGKAAARIVQEYDWNQVGAARIDLLMGLQERSTKTPSPARPASRSAVQMPATSQSDAAPPPVAETVSANISANVTAHPVAGEPTGPTPDPEAPELISVVLPAYNREESVAQAIRSVLQQTWPTIELIVIDDCSQDGTLAVVEAIDDPRLRIIRMEQNSGQSAARNRGIAAARGRWIAFQDSDDEWLPDKLRLQMERIYKMGPDCVAAYCGMAIEGGLPGERLTRTRVRYLPPAHITQLEGDISRTLYSTSLASTQMVVARSDVLRAIGGFDEDQISLVDWDLSIRLAERGTFACVDQILVIQRFSDNSMTGDRRKRLHSRARIMKKHGERLATVPEALARQYQALAGDYRREGFPEEARRALWEARRVQPTNPGIWARILFLQLKRILPLQRR